MSTLERTPQQQLDALARANGHRAYRKHFKRRLRSGRAAAVDVIVDPPREMATMKVIDLLVSVPKVGRVKAERALRTARISPSKSLAGLSARQRDELPEALPHVRRVGVCGSCSGPVLRQVGSGAECPCGETTIPEGFFRVGGWRL